MLPETNNQNINSSYENDGPSYQEIIYILRKHKSIIMLIVGLVLMLTLFYTSLQKPVYSSTGLIMVDDPTTMNMFDMSTFRGEKTYLSNEIQILSSRTISEKTIEKLLDSDYRNNLYLFETRKYEFSWFKDIPGYSFFNSISKPPEIGKVVSDSLFNVFANRFNQKLIIKNVKKTDMLNISIRSRDADEAALLINTLIEVYSLMDLEWARGEMSHLEKFLSEQILKKEIQLAESEQALQQFQEKDQIFGVDENSSLLLNNLISAESQYYKAKAESNIINERKKYILSQLTEKEKTLTQTVSNSINDRLFALKNEIAIKEAELVSAIAQQGKSHKIVGILEEKLERLMNNLQNETRNLIAQGISVADPIKFRQAMMDSVISFNASSAMLETKANEFKELVNEYQGQLGSLPEKVLEFTRLSRNLKIYADTFSLMRQKLEEVRITEAAQMGKVRIVDEARPNYNRISPKNKKNMFLGLLLGMGLGIGFAMLREFMDNTIKTVSELEARNLTILALIPAIGRQFDSKHNKTKRYQKKMGNAEKIQRRLITYEDPKSPVSEAYRSLRTGLLYSQISKKDEGSVILISSPGPGEGKTTTIVNLAITYANLGLKTILLDTDLRKPVTHKVFSVERDPGISKVISGIEENYSKIIKSTDIHNLDVVTSGIIPTNPSEILASSYMENLIKQLRKDYDIILMDAPPLLAVTDAFVCMKYIDQLILVVRSGVTEKSGLDRSLDQIRQTNTELSGIVVNAIDESTSYYSGYYSNYYQYYREDDN